MPALKSTPKERGDLLAYISRLDGVPIGALTTPQPEIPAQSIDAVLRPNPGDWPTYNGNVSANRHSSLDQINTANAGQLQLPPTRVEALYAPEMFGELPNAAVTHV